MRSLQMLGRPIVAQRARVQEIAPRLAVFVVGGLCSRRCVDLDLCEVDASGSTSVADRRSYGSNRWS